MSGNDPWGKRDDRDDRDTCKKPSILTDDFFILVFTHVLCTGLGVFIGAILCMMVVL